MGGIQPSGATVQAGLGDDVTLAIERAAQDG
jgi:hypothetical protein